MIIEIEVSNEIEEIAEKIFEKLHFDPSFKKEMKEIIIVDIVKAIIDAIVNRKDVEISNAKITPSYSMPWVYVLFENNEKWIIKFEEEITLKAIP
ncbi:MAG: hypothetical protein QXT31_03410 [Candidatus Bathyarchaeia archaeon]